MGCLKLHIDHDQEPSPFLGVWKGDRLEKSDSYFFEVLDEKRGQQNFCIDYYPFGGTFNSYTQGTENQYKYNQGTGEKTFDTERQPELQIDMSKYRTYDYNIGRWWQVDPAADMADQESLTPYHYSLNNPIKWNDPLGDCIIIGGCIDLVVRTARFLYNISPAKTFNDGVNNVVGGYTKATGAIANGYRNQSSNYDNAIANGGTPADVQQSTDQAVTEGTAQALTGILQIHQAGAEVQSALLGGATESTSRVAASNAVESSAVTYYRVQGGGSFQRVSIDGAGNVSFRQRGSLNVSKGSLDHANYFKELRGGDAKIYQFDIPDWLDNMVDEFTVPQKGYRTNPNNQNGLAPKLVDPNQPGTSLELPPTWNKWFQENYIKGSGKVTN